MKTAKQLDYSIHHLCIYDDNPRENMMPYLRWHHGITNYFSGEVFHVTGEGHSDYTFLGCGGRAFQIQIEAPPFQFEYERAWWHKHGKSYNHICWLTSDARASMEQLLASGATEVMPFEEFPTYDGFVVHDPEGRWIEIMEYTDENFRVQEFTHAPSGQCGLEMIGNVEVCKDVSSMLDWYQRALNLKVAKDYQSEGNRTVYLVDKDYDPQQRNNIFVLQNAQTDDQKARLAKRAGYISEIVYQAKDIQKAWDDAIWAGMKALVEPAIDQLTGALTGYLLEPCGNNTIMLREHFHPSNSK